MSCFDDSDFCGHYDDYIARRRPVTAALNQTCSAITHSSLTFSCYSVQRQFASSQWLDNKQWSNEERIDG